jgi:hypothetical protein
MSIHIAIATAPAPLSVRNGKVGRAEQKAKRTAMIAVIAAAAFAANIASADASTHRRHAGLSMPHRSFTSHYAPSDYGRYDQAGSTRSPVFPEAGHGAFAPADFAP